MQPLCGKLFVLYEVAEKVAASLAWKIVEQRFICKECVYVISYIYGETEVSFMILYFIFIVLL